jgi:hypothetical protein
MVNNMVNQTEPIIILKTEKLETPILGMTLHYTLVQIGRRVYVAFGRSPSEAQREGIQKAKMGIGPDYTI